MVGGILLARHLINAQRITVPAVGGEYTEAVVGAPQLINPLYAGVSDVDADLAELIYSGLMRYDTHQGLVTDLAESYEVSEDGLQYTFVIRDDARWHDGQRVEADDVIFTISAIQNMEYRSPLEGQFEDVAVEQIDQQTIRLTISEPFAPFLSYLTVGILPSHIWQEIPAINAPLTELNTKPIGSGPYQFEKLVKDSKGSIVSYTLVRHDQYHNEAPYLESITFKFYPSNDAALDALRNHNVEGVGYVPPRLVDEIQEDVDGVLVTPGMTQYTAAFFNLDSNIVSNQDVRDALVLATDTQAIIDQALFGHGAQLSGLLLPGMLGAGAEREVASFNPSAAEELLIGAGWTLSSETPEPEVEETEEDSSDEETVEDTTSDEETDEETVEEVVEEEPAAEPVISTVREKSGTSLSINLVTVNTPELLTVAELLKSQWADVGVELNVTAVDSNTLQNSTLTNRDYDILLSGELYRIDSDLYAFWHSSQTSYPGLNLSGYENSDVDELIMQARGTANLQEREDLYQQIQDEILADTPAVLLYQPLYTYFIPEELQGVELNSIVSPSDRFSQVQEWYVKTRKIIGSEE